MTRPANPAGARTQRDREIRTALSGVADTVQISTTGKVTAKRSYFYRHGMDAGKFNSEIRAALSSKGINPEQVASEDRWAVWPKTSYFVATFQAPAA